MPVTDVARLLADSRAQHAAYRRAVQGHIKVGAQVVQRTPQYAPAEAAVSLALALRLTAHALDPDHADPAWQADTVPHEQLVTFYQRYQDIP